MRSFSQFVTAQKLRMHNEKILYVLFTIYYKNWRESENFEWTHILVTPYIKEIEMIIWNHNMLFGGNTWKEINFFFLELVFLRKVNNIPGGNWTKIRHLIWQFQASNNKHCLISKEASGQYYTDILNSHKSAIIRDSV